MSFSLRHISHNKLLEEWLLSLSFFLFVGWRAGLLHFGLVNKWFRNYLTPMSKGTSFTYIRTL